MEGGDNGGDNDGDDSDNDEEDDGKMREMMGRSEWGSSGGI